MTLFILVCACRWVRKTLASLGPVEMDRARRIELTRHDGC